MTSGDIHLNQIHIVLAPAYVHDGSQESRPPLSRDSSTRFQTTDSDSSTLQSVYSTQRTLCSHFSIDLQGDKHSAANVSVQRTERFHSLSHLDGLVSPTRDQPRSGSIERRAEDTSFGVERARLRDFLSSAKGQTGFVIPPRDRTIVG